jgi:hypothetical protein
MSKEAQGCGQVFTDTCQIGEQLRMFNSPSQKTTGDWVYMILLQGRFRETQKTLANLGFDFYSLILNFARIWQVGEWIHIREVSKHASNKRRQVMIFPLLKHFKVR